MSIEKLKKNEIEEWDKFVFNHLNSQSLCLYHYQNLLKIPRECQRYVHLVAKERGKFVGIMPNYIANKKMVSEGGIFIKDGFNNLNISFIDFVDKYVKCHNLVASLIYPDTTVSEEQIHFLKSVGYEGKKSKVIFLSLEPSLKDIWDNLNRKNRNAIRKAKKSGVKVTKARVKKDMEDYHKLNLSAGKRKHRPVYPLSYYHDLWDILKEQYHIMDVYFAELDGKRIASVMVGKFNKKSHYNSGDYLVEYGSYQPNNLLHWQIISDLKEEGFKTYKLGAVGLNSPDPQVRGIAHFKMSWGGTLVDYVHYVKYRSWFTKKKNQINVLVPMVLRIAKRKFLQRLN